MLNGRLSSPGAIVLLLLLTASVPVCGAALQDSLRTALHDDVSAGQRATAMMASAYRAMNTDLLEAHGHARQALTMADRSGDPLVEHNALVCLGRVEERMGLFTDAMKTALKVVELAQELGDPRLIATSLRDLSNAYRLNGMSEKAVEEARNSLAIMLPTRPAAEVEEAQLFLIRTLKDAGRFDEAYQLATRCLANARQQQDTLQEARLNRSIGEVFVAQRRFADAVIHLTLAGRHLDAHGTAAEQFGLVDALTVALTGLGRTQEAAVTLRKAAALLPEVDSWSNRQRLATLRYHLAAAQQNWRDAVVLLEGIKAASDSVLIARLDMQMARMQMNYQLASKEKANEQLRSENAKSAELIAGVQLHNRLLIGALLLFTVLAVALFLAGRHNRRMARRLRLKNAVVKRQHDQIHAKNLELQRQNLRLAETLMSEEEKEMMIKEIHHRVKNNLQVVDSLLQIQGIGSTDPGVGRVLREAQGRIRSMALVHENIYRSNGGEGGSLRPHLEKLARNVLVAHGVHDRISVQVDAAVPMFRMDALLPFTLVMNELLTNAVKYAFTGRDAGRIAIAVRETGAGYELLFTDDGAGMAPDTAKGEEPSFGLELVRMLAAQLNGSIDFIKGNGTTVRMAFAPDPVPLRAAS